MRLDATPQSPLLWDVDLSEVESVTLDLDLSAYSFSDPAVERGYLFTVEELVKKIEGTPVKEVVFYEGGCQPGLGWIVPAEYQEWLIEGGLASTPHTRRVFGMEQLASYLHRLTPPLPDEVTPLVKLNLSDAGGIVQAAQLASKERFLHIEVILEGLFVPSKTAPVAVALPPDRFLTEEVIGELNALLAGLGEARLIPEIYLNEMWDGVDAIYAPFLTPLGERMVKGFEATGGEVIRGRGIRTPDLLVPNQSR